MQRSASFFQYSLLAAFRVGRVSPAFHEGDRPQRLLAEVVLFCLKLLKFSDLFAILLIFCAKCCIMVEQRAIGTLFIGNHDYQEKEKRYEI